MFEKAEKLGLGGIPIQAGGLEKAKELISVMTMDGYHVIDSAKGYSVSEEWFGEALIGRRQRFYLCSKSMARDKNQIAKDIDDSLEKFQTDYLDLYQIHNLTKKEDYEKIKAEDGALAALIEAKEAGKIKHIGVSSHSIDFISSILDEGIFEAIQLPYNIIEEKAEEVFKKAKEKGITTMAMKPLCGGVLEDYHLALSFFNQNSYCDVILVGMENSEEYIKNQVAITEEYDLECQKRALKLKEELGDKFCRRCGYCMPCPEGINIPIMWLVEAYANRYMLWDWAKARYDAEKVRAIDCNGCKQCESLCPYNLEICLKMEEVANLFK